VVDDRGDVAVSRVEGGLAVGQVVGDRVCARDRDLLVEFAVPEVDGGGDVGEVEAPGASQDGAFIGCAG
jgi:hypothetical protein